jgi:hypothetical protein
MSKAKNVHGEYYVAPAPMVDAVESLRRIMETEALQHMRRTLNDPRYDESTRFASIADVVRTTDSAARGITRQLDRFIDAMDRRAMSEAEPRTENW